MSNKVVIVCDPGIDGAFAVALALFDPRIEVLGLAATAGNVSAEQATDNIHILVNQLDPPRLPRLGAALPVEYEIDGTGLHGPRGLGGTDFPCARLHSLPTSDKLINDLVRQFPGEVTLVSLGPLSMVARAFDIYPDLPMLVKRVVVLGGTLHEPGNVGPVTEFHFTCDPGAVRKVLNSQAPITLITLDSMRKVLFSPRDLLELPAENSTACKFLRQIVPFGIAATSNTYGIEGFHLKDVLGIAAVAIPEAIQTKHVHVDVETRGDLTRGMSVFDQRAWVAPIPNVEMVHHVDGQAVRDYIFRILGTTE